MNRIGPTLALAALLMTGCSRDNGKASNSAANASAPGVNAAAEVGQVKGPVRFQPGEWSNDFNLTNFYAPGVRDKVKADGMRAMFERQFVSFKNRCMTPQEAVSPTAKMFTDAADSGTCTFDRFRMQDGRIEAALSCIRDDHKPGPAIIVEGSYTPTSFDMRTITQLPNFASPGSPAMMMTAHVTARRVGPCHAPGAK